MSWAVNMQIGLFWAMPLWFLMVGALQYVDRQPANVFLSRSFLETWIVYWELLLLLSTMSSYLIPHAQQNNLTTAPELVLRLGRCLLLSLALLCTSTVAQVVPLGIVAGLAVIELAVGYRAAPPWATWLEMVLAAGLCVLVLTLRLAFK